MGEAVGKAGKGIDPITVFESLPEEVITELRSDKRSRC